MSSDDLDAYESDLELALYREYRDVLPMFAYVVETERRFYLANDVHVTPRGDGAGRNAWFEIELGDAWVWDMYRPARFVTSVRILTSRDVNIEQIAKSDDAPTPPGGWK